MADIGSLVISLEANMAKFMEDMTNAEKIAEHAMEQIKTVSNSAMSAVKVAVAGAAAAFTVETFAEGIEGAIKGAGALHDLSEKTGATVETLSGLKQVAELSGTGMEEVGKGAQKLAKNMYDAASGNQQAASKFAALGVSVTDTQGKLRDSGDVMVEVAKKISSMDNETQKVAVSQQLFGKAGANLIPMMNDLAEQGGMVAQVTSEMADNADAYEKNLIRLKQRKEELFNTIAGAMLPAMRDFTDAMLASDSAVSRMNKSAKDLSADNTLQTWARDAAKGAAFVIDAFDGVVRVVNIIGKAIGMIAADAVALTSGDFAAIKENAKNFASDVDDIMEKVTFSAKLQAEFDKTDAGLKKTAQSMKASTSIAMDANPMNRSPFEAFLESLDKMQVKTQQNEYAMLRLEAAQKAAKEQGADLASALSKIDQLQRDQSARAINEYSIKLKEQNDQYQLQYELIGKSTLETELLVDAQKHHLETQNLINAAEKSGKPLDAEGQRAAWEASAKATDADAEAIKRNYEAHRSWATGTATAFNTYVENASNSAKQAETLFGNAFKGMEDALVSFVKTGKLDFTKLADSIITDLIRIAVQKSIAGIAGSMFGGSSSTPWTPMAKGGAWVNGVQAFADGGVVNSPTLFPFAGGTGLMGEAGPEAIMPLTRGPDGKLGVMANGLGGGGANIEINVTVNPQNGQTQVSGNDSNMSSVGKRIGDAVRSVMLDEMRPGGLLAQAGVQAA